MELLSPELTLAIAAAAGALAANVSKWVIRWVGNYVRGTPNKLDDRIFDAALGAVHLALAERDEGSAAPEKPTDG